jgi:hypothetical protein
MRPLTSRPSPRRGRARRVAGLVGCHLGVVALLVAAVAPAALAQVEARGIDRVCPAPSAAAPAFPDVGATHGDAIRCAAAYGVVTGYDDGTVRPGLPVTRGQVASMVERWLRTATGFALPVPGDSPFSDVATTVHRDAILALADAGIVGGRGDGTFGPGAPLTRGQLAAIVTAAISYADVFEVDGPLPPPADASVGFSDISGSVFEDEIRALAGVGVVQGDTSGAYLPGATVTRGQLATFLMRSADYLDRHQRWKPTARIEVLTVELTADAVVGFDVDEAMAEQQATAVLTVNGFNGTLAYTIDLSSLSGPFAGGGGAVIRLGRAGSNGPLALRLADGAALDAATADVVTGVVVEADSAVRFADLVASPEQAYLVIGTAELPAGAVRGQLALR